ncbi:MAG: cyclic nucleotide-binding/CBS domain-containing protein [Candidatus Nanoarchaeia archaeon]
MIKDLKIHDALVCKKDMPIVEAAKILRDNHRRHLYVVDDDYSLIGIVSPVDITSKVVAEGYDPHSLFVKDIMNNEVESCDVNQKAEFAMKIMLERKLYTCPITEGSKFLGVVDYESVANKITERIEV